MGPLLSKAGHRPPTSPYDRTRRRPSAAPQHEPTPHHRGPRRVWAQLFCVPPVPLRRSRGHRPAHERAHLPVDGWRGRRVQQVTQVEHVHPQSIAGHETTAGFPNGRMGHRITPFPQSGRLSCKQLLAQIGLRLDRPIPQPASRCATPGPLNGPAAQQPPQRPRQRSHTRQPALEVPTPDQSSTNQALVRVPKPSRWRRHRCSHLVVEPHPPAKPIVSIQGRH